MFVSDVLVFSDTAALNAPFSRQDESCWGCKSGFLHPEATCELWTEASCQSSYFINLSQTINIDYFCNFIGKMSWMCIFVKRIRAWIVGLKRGSRNVEHYCSHPAGGCLTTKSLSYTCNWATTQKQKQETDPMSVEVHYCLAAAGCVFCSASVFASACACLQPWPPPRRR